MREICEACGRREAQLRFTEVRLDGKRTLQLCAQCAAERGVPVGLGDEALLDTERIWTSLLRRHAGEHGDESLACPRCGWTYVRFEAEGRLGCPQCYQTFQGDMTRLLAAYHGDSRHRGKVPHGIGHRLDLQRRIRSLKERIQFAVGAERFEDAARLRDEVRDLEKELQRLLGQAGAP
ncbi:MAG: UvrB/UvrC motif-containing protein [Candidatus Krumholzibacteriota bacterium]|nr:UvrB/UvrC motif-containing protein [Candidatus Krumholzibacteriota bacterium]